MLAFIIRIYLIQSIPSYNGRFKLLPNSQYAELMKEWLLSLPKVLWELKTTHLNTTKVIIYIYTNKISRILIYMIIHYRLLL